MEDNKHSKSALRVNSGIDQPPSVNPGILGRTGRKRRRKYSENEFVDGILAGNRTMLSQAITLVESSLPEHSEMAQAIIEKCLVNVKRVGQDWHYRCARCREKHIHRIVWLAYSWRRKESSCADYRSKQRAYNGKHPGRQDKDGEAQYSSFCLHQTISSLPDSWEVWHAKQGKQ